MRTYSFELTGDSVHFQVLKFTDKDLTGAFAQFHKTSEYKNIMTSGPEGVYLSGLSRLR